MIVLPLAEAGVATRRARMSLRGYEYEDGSSLVDGEVLVLASGVRGQRVAIPVQIPEIDLLLQVDELRYRTRYKRGGAGVTTTTTTSTTVPTTVTQGTAEAGTREGSTAEGKGERNAGAGNAPGEHEAAGVFPAAVAIPPGVQQRLAVPEGGSRGSRGRWRPRTGWR